jgi:hypothetical protein
VGRQKYLFAVSHDAARRTAVLYTPTRTCARHGIPSLTYFTNVVRKLRDNVPATNLLPDPLARPRHRGARALGHAPSLAHNAPRGPQQLTHQSGHGPPSIG